MPTLPHSLRRWGTPDFAHTLCNELRSLPTGSLPLDRAVTQAGLVDDSALTVSHLSSGEDAEAIYARVGVFFTEVVINCGCGADPMPQNNYCTLAVTLSKADASARFELIDT